MRNKKYNPRKLSQHNAKTKVNNHCMVFVQGIPTTLTYNRKTHIITHKVDPQIHDEVVNARHKWTITMAVLCTNEFGSDVIEWDELSVDSPVLQTELADLLTDKHREILTRCEPEYVLRFAWIAHPTGDVLPDDELYSIFKRLRGFQVEIFENN